MTYAKKVDANHSIIVKALRDLGCSVFDTSRVAGGFPDLVVGKNSKTALVEVKADSKAKFTAAQQAFILNWKGSTVCRIHDVEGAINLVKTLENS
jgi:Holliday junction resolvase